MSITSLFEHGPESTVSSLVHDLRTDKKYFFESYGATPMDNVQSLFESIHMSTGSKHDKVGHIDECWYKFIFNSSSDKM